jgi:hypothetical protein
MDFIHPAMDPMERIAEMQKGARRAKREEKRARGKRPN